MERSKPRVGVSACCEPPSCVVGERGHSTHWVGGGEGLTATIVAERKNLAGAVGVREHVPIGIIHKTFGGAVRIDDPACIIESNPGGNPAAVNEGGDVTIGVGKCGGSSAGRMVSNERCSPKAIGDANPLACGVRANRDCLAAFVGEACQLSGGRMNVLARVADGIDNSGSIVGIN